MPIPYMKIFTKARLSLVDFSDYYNAKPTSFYKDEVYERLSFLDMNGILKRSEIRVRHIRTRKFRCGKSGLIIGAVFHKSKR
jgi:hypothetical protein